MKPREKAKNHPSAGYAQTSQPPAWIPSSLVERFTSENTTSHRVYSEPGAWVERYGSDFIISYKSVEQLARLVPALKEWAAAMPIPINRIYARLLAKASPEKNAPTLEFGPKDSLPETIVTENGVRFGIDFSAGYSTGLFIDQRLNRAVLRAQPPKSLLNTFAYTCSFSVVAALGGAQTTSVDLSNRSLLRGKKNFELNNLPTEKHQFIADDVFAAIPYLQRKGRRFDAIVLDPPTFSRGNKGRTFQAEKDFEKLLMLALEVAERNAHILLSTNCSVMNVRDLEQIARYALKANRLTGDLRQGQILPDIPASMAASTLWLTLR